MPSVCLSVTSYWGRPSVASDVSQHQHTRYKQRCGNVLAQLCSEHFHKYILIWTCGCLLSCLACYGLESEGWGLGVGVPRRVSFELCDEDHIYTMSPGLGVNCLVRGCCPPLQQQQSILAGRGAPLPRAAAEPKFSWAGYPPPQRKTGYILIYIYISVCSFVR